MATFKTFEQYVQQRKRYREAAIPGPANQQEYQKQAIAQITQALAKANPGQLNQVMTALGVKPQPTVVPANAPNATNAPNLANATNVANTANVANTGNVAPGQFGRG